MKKSTGAPTAMPDISREYLDLSAGLDFEATIMVKENAPELSPAGTFPALAASHRDVRCHC